MYTVYVIEDEIGKRYTGWTNNFQRRLPEHNRGRTKYTRRGRSWKLVYSEDYDNKKEAILREKFLKTGQGRKFLDQHCRVV